VVDIDAVCRYVITSYLLVKLAVGCNNEQRRCDGVYLSYLSSTRGVRQINIHEAAINTTDVPLCPWVSLSLAAAAGVEWTGYSKMTAPPVDDIMLMWPY